MPERVAIEWILIVGCAVSRQMALPMHPAVEDWMSISKKIGFALAVVVSAFIVNCSDDGEPNNTAINCDSATSKCSMDPMPTTAQRNLCNELLNDSECGSKYAALLLCLSDNQICGSDNKTDEDATAAKCKSQSDALPKSCADKVDGGTVR
jgi:hypothetical protein